VGNSFKMKKLRHSKYKNTGFLYEMIVRQITADIISGKDSIAESILAKYFRKGQELNKELQLYQALLAKNNLSESKTNSLIDTVIDARKRLSEHKLHKEKFELVREIKNNYNIDEFFRSQVPSYRVLASIYKLFENATSSELYKPNDVYSARNTLLESITGSPVVAEKRDALLEAFSKEDADIRNLSQFVFLKRFNEKYKSLSTNQKKLLSEYINNVSNTNSLSSYIKGEVPKIQKTLKRLSESVKDEVTIIKLNEVVKQLDTATHIKVIKENHITALMQSYELIKELRNVIKG